MLELRKMVTPFWGKGSIWNWGRGELLEAGAALFLDLSSHYIYVFNLGKNIETYLFDLCTLCTYISIEIQKKSKNRKTQNFASHYNLISRR